MSCERPSQLCRLAQALTSWLWPIALALALPLLRAHLHCTRGIIHEELRACSAHMTLTSVMLRPGWGGKTAVRSSRCAAASGKVTPARALSTRQKQPTPTRGGGDKHGATVLPKPPGACVRVYTCGFCLCFFCECLCGCRSLSSMVSVELLCGSCSHCALVPAIGLVRGAEDGVWTMVVPSSRVGTVIGKQGSNLKDISSASRCSCTVRAFLFVSLTDVWVGNSPCVPLTHGLAKVFMRPTDH